MKSQLILIARGLSINNQKLVDLLFQPLTRKHEIRGDAFSKSLSIVLFAANLEISRSPDIALHNNRLIVSNMSFTLVINFGRSDK